MGDSLLTANRQHTNFNELVEEDSNVGGGSTPRPFDHDNNGNLFTDAIYDYQWDALNRLRSVTRISDGLIIATSTYDCQNRRMRKVVTNSGSLDGTTDYYYAGWRVCEEYTLTGSSETLKYQYVWGATYHDELIARDDRQGGATVTQLNDGTGADRQFQHGNTLFSVFAVTDETGAVLERYQYDPYGNQTVMDASFNVLTDSAIDQEFSYTGQRFDAETDLYYYKNRFYSSEQGRFISRDLIVYDGDSLCLYEYAKSNAMSNIDLLGLKPKKPGVPNFTKKAIKALDKAVSAVVGCHILKTNIISSGTNKKVGSFEAKLGKVKGVSLPIGGKTGLPGAGQAVPSPSLIKVKISWVCQPGSNKILWKAAETTTGQLVKMSSCVDTIGHCSNCGS